MSFLLWQHSTQLLDPLGFICPLNLNSQSLIIWQSLGPSSNSHCRNQQMIQHSLRARLHSPWEEELIERILAAQIASLRVPYCSCEIKRLFRLYNLIDRISGRPFCRALVGLLRPGKSYHASKQAGGQVSETSLSMISLILLLTIALI